MINKSSLSHPLQIDVVTPISGTGAIGMSFCPGKHIIGALSGGNWYRDLDTDLAAIQNWGANVVLTLLESSELTEMRVEKLGATVKDFGIIWNWLEIRDGGVPEGDVAARWQDIKIDLIARLARGERVFIHCKGGLGRTGTLAAELLVSLGEEMESAIRRVRHARKGAIETQGQEAYLRGLISPHGPTDSRQN